MSEQELTENQKKFREVFGKKEDPEQELTDEQKKLQDALKSEKPIIVYNITNQESWSAAFKEFSKGFFTLLINGLFFSLLFNAFGCIDLVKIIHGP